MQLLCIAGGLAISQVVWIIYVILLYTGKIKIWSWL